MSNSNSRSDSVVTITISDGTSGDCISDSVARELERRMTAYVPDSAQTGDAIVSRTAPENTSVIWYPADENGFPLGPAYIYDPLQGQWVSTVAETPKETCLDPNFDNMIKETADGCLTVQSGDVEDVAVAASPKLSTDSGNAIRLGSDGGWYVPDDLGGSASSEGQILILSSPVGVGSGQEESPSQEQDLSGLVTSMPSWATHAIVRAEVIMMTKDFLSASNDKSYGRVIVNGIDIAEVGVNPGPNSITDTQGSNTNDANVELDGTSITWEFRVNKGPNWNDTKNYVGYKLQLLGFIRAGIETP